MRVLYVSKASRVVAHRDKLAALARRVQLHAVVPRRWGDAPREEADPRHPPVEELPVRLHGHNHLHLYRGLDPVLERVAPDLVHVDEEPYSAVTFQLAWLCRRRSVPFLFFAWQNLSKRLPPPFGLLRRRVFRTASGGLAGTDSAASVLRRAGFRGPLEVIPQMGVDPDRFRPDPDERAARRARLAQDPEFVVGYVGRLIPEKGVDVLLEAMAGLAGARLLVVGDGPARSKLEGRASKPDLAGRVHFVGEVPSTDVARWMTALDALVLPSRTTPGWTEQFGRVLVEAMATACPVVVSDSGEMAGVVGPAGSVVPEGRVAPLQEALRRLQADPAERERRGRDGRARVLERFTQARVAERTEAFYRRVLEGGA